jgi:hypothetical protein
MSVQSRSNSEEPFSAGDGGAMASTVASLVTTLPHMGKHDFLWGWVQNRAAILTLLTPRSLKSRASPRRCAMLASLFQAPTSMKYSLRCTSDSKKRLCSFLVISSCSSLASITLKGNGKSRVKNHLGSMGF